LQEILHTIQATIFCLPVCYQETKIKTQDYDFACCCVWVWNLVCHTGWEVWDQVAKENT